MQPVVDRLHLSAIGYLTAYLNEDEATRQEKSIWSILDRNVHTWPVDCALLPTTRLATRNPFPQDGRIRFVEATHKYYIDDVEAPVSVTSYIHAPFPIFDTPQVIANLSDRTRSERYVGMTDKEIARAWRDNANVASNLGTRMHAAIEVALNTGYWSRDPTIALELAMARDFFKIEIEAKGYQIFRTEPKVFMEPPHLLPGSVDCIFYDPADQDYGILDWKRSKEITLTANGRNGFGNMPLFDRLENTNYSTYSLQLNMYAYILQTYYGMKVNLNKLFIVVFHPNNANHTYQMIPVLKIYAMAEELGRNYPVYVARALEHKQLEIENELWRDAPEIEK